MESLSNQQLDNLGRLHMKLCLARVESVLQSNTMVHKGEFVMGPLRHIVFRKNTHLEQLIDATKEINYLNQKMQDAEMIFGPTSSSTHDLHDQSNISPMTLYTSSSTTIATNGSTSNSDYDDASLGVVVNMLRRSQEQLRMVIRKYDEQYQQLMAKVDDISVLTYEQRIVIESIEQKVDGRCPQLLPASSSSLSHSTHATTLGYRQINKSDNDSNNNHSNDFAILKCM